MQAYRINFNMMKSDYICATGTWINSRNRIALSARIPDSVCVQMLTACIEISFQMQYQLFHNTLLSKINAL